MVATSSATLLKTIFLSQSSSLMVVGIIALLLQCRCQFTHAQSLPTHLFSCGAGDITEFRPGGAGLLKYIKSDGEMSNCSLRMTGPFSTTWIVFVGMSKASHVCGSRETGIFINSEIFCMTTGAADVYSAIVFSDPLLISTQANSSSFSIEYYAGEIMLITNLMVVLGENRKYLKKEN